MVLTVITMMMKTKMKTKMKTTMTMMMIIMIIVKKSSLPLLLSQRNSFLVLDLGLDIVDCIGCLDVQGDGLAGERLSWRNDADDEDDDEDNDDDDEDDDIISKAPLS